jgi:predicted NUDIX family NTP pyrophosphohydrolase
MQVSCGLLMYVPSATGPRILLVHPGGPFWRNKDHGAWSIPKGLADPGEELLAAARREFTEETSLIADGPFIELTPLKQKSRKLIHCWAFEGEAQPIMIGASQFEIEWPSGSGRKQSFPEVDDAQLFSVNEAMHKILPGQAGFVRELAALLTR